MHGHTACFENPGRIELRSNWWQPDYFKSLVVALEKCTGENGIMCADNKKRDEYFKKHQFSFQSANMRFASRIYKKDATAEFMDKNGTYWPIRAASANWFRATLDAL